MLVVPHRLPGPAVEAELLERENRFLGRCRLVDGSEVHAHIPDRGRLLNLLIPGARVWLYRAANPERKTIWSLLVAREPQTGTLVAIDPAGANARAKPLLEQGLIADIGIGWAVRPEATVGSSRFDFLLTRGEERLYVEVKSVGVVREGTALFPDAPTERGVRHLEELAAIAREGKARVLVLFVAQRADAERIAPDTEIDPVFAATMWRVRRQVKFLGVRFAITPEGCTWMGEVPVVLKR